MWIQMSALPHKNITESQCRTQLLWFQKLSRITHKEYGRTKTPALKQGVLQKYNFGSFEDEVMKCYRIKIKTTSHSL